MVASSIFLVIFSMVSYEGVSASGEPYVLTINQLVSFMVARIIYNCPFGSFSSLRIVDATLEGNKVITPLLALPVVDKKTYGQPHFAQINAVLAVVSFVSCSNEISNPLQWLITWCRLAAELSPAALRLRILPSSAPVG